jgi:hypothetical protein
MGVVLRVVAARALGRLEQCTGVRWRLWVLPGM